MTLTCSCGNPIPSTRDKTARYCSEECRQALKAANRVHRRPPSHGIRQCAWCGHDFPYHPKYRAKYCDGTCRGLSRNEGKSCLLPTSCRVPWRQCATCHQQFISHHLRLYCSDGCKPKLIWTLAPRTMKPCDECGTAFNGTQRQRFCSAKCGHRAHKRHRRYQLRSSRTGSEFITIRLVGQRDGWSCHICGRKVKRKDASLDHLNPLSLGGSHTLDNVAIAHHLCNSVRGAGRVHAQLRLLA